MKKDSRVKAVISLDAVEHNFREMRKNIAEETKMIAVIKADAYGHGAVPVAHLIEDYDYIWGFAAATAEEAIHLREAGISQSALNVIWRKSCIWIPERIWTSPITD